MKPYFLYVYSCCAPILCPNFSFFPGFITGCRWMFLFSFFLSFCKCLFMTEHAFIEKTFGRFINYFYKIFILKNVGTKNFNNSLQVVIVKIFLFSCLFSYCGKYAKPNNKVIVFNTRVDRLHHFKELSRKLFIIFFVWTFLKCHLGSICFKNSYWY